MVMDYVEATPVKKIIAHEPNGTDERELQEKISARIVSALLSFVTLRPPTDMAPAPGPLYGGRMSYLVWDFEDPVAPNDYHSVQELQDDINERINVSTGPILSIISSHVTDHRGPGKTQGFARRLLERSALRVLRGRP